MRSNVLVFGVAVVAWLLAQFATGAFIHPRTWEYEDIANSLLAGAGYAYLKNGTTYVASQSCPL